jgi:NADPH-dependent glutamate synthase beta subunit-like oxidoreductase/Pyruvate/2-oxoacid:ferredoxin oxidoreductase delta subunit
LFLSDAQLSSETARCEFCEEKPCRKACPADCSPADFIMAARLGSPEDIRRAAALIMTRNPFGGICGAICPDRFCQAACVHKGFDRPVEIPTVQAAVVARAKKLGAMPILEKTRANGKKMAVVGAGPAGIAAALTLAQEGFAVDLLESSPVPGGAVGLIPAYRLDQEVVRSDVEWALSHSRISLHVNTCIEDPVKLLEQGYSGVVVAGGLHRPIRLGIPGEELAQSGNEFLRNLAGQSLAGAVAIVGGGAIACDCAVAAKAAGASRVELFTLESLSEMPLTPKERVHLLEHGIEVSGRCRVVEVLKGPAGVDGIRTIKVELPAGEAFHPAKVRDQQGTEQNRLAFKAVIVAIGNRPAMPKLEHPLVMFAGDGVNGPTTAVEAVASGKNVACELAAVAKRKKAVPAEKPTKSVVVIPGFRTRPVPLDTDFFGRRIPSPFLLSAAPPTDGYEQMKLALEAGWAGGIMKTAFLDVPIHIPSDYMHVFNAVTYGNCDNVSGHSLSRVTAEVERLVKEYPDRLIGASTGGPLTGKEEEDKAAWQKNMRLLEEAGAGVVEFSLSCPQGGDGTEGDIVSQNARLTAKIIGWLLETSNPEVPKLFKLTAAVTSVAVIIKAVREVLDRYPGKKAGVTLANTFPTLGFRPRLNGDHLRWDEGVLVGMSGEGVAPISNLTLAGVASLGVTVSGNGGPMDYKSAAHFMALGARTVQFCTVAMKHGVGIVEELHSGLSHLMASRGMRSVEELIGCALPDPITGFMELRATKRISACNTELCASCGNCTRCAYLAISLDKDKHPVTQATHCIGCSLCTKKCFTHALYMRERTAEELAALKEN